ncbi:MAG: hypothetical protein HRU20_31580, partial [Pseudomonadales bacterium]|nr:hypothetical protein [Pseudomonadales bacterium]
GIVHFLEAASIAKKQMENILLDIKEEIKINPQIIDDKILGLQLCRLGQPEF